jgi:hypothetical protein
VDELSSLYVDAMLQRVECYESLAELLLKKGDKEGAQKLLQECEQVARQLVAK